MKTTFQLSVILLGLFLPSAYLFGQEEKGLLWEITGNDLAEPSYLFGTIHLLCPEDLDISRELKESLSSTEQLVLELDFDDPEMMTALQKYIMLDDGMTVDKFMTAEEYASLDAFSQENMGTPAETFKTIKPFFIMSMFYPQIMGCQTASMEQELIRLSKGKEVIGLETIEQQVAAIGTMSNEEQADMLMEMIKDPEQGREGFLAMLKYYSEGDISGLYSFTSTEFLNTEGFNEAMLDDRNKSWIPKMKKLMQEKPTFFGVGAAHLGGAAGVISLLKAAGYELSAIAMNTAEEKDEVIILSEEASKILKKWRLEESQVEGAVDEIIANLTEQNPNAKLQIEGQRGAITQMLKNSSLEYRDNGKFIIVIPGNSTRQGEWTFDETAKTITEIDEDGEISVKTILEITDTQLTIRNDKGKTKIYVPYQ